MTATQLAADIDARLARLPAHTTPQLRSVRRGVSKQLRAQPADVVLDLADALLTRPGMDHRFLAYELIRHHPAALASLRERDLRRLGRGLDSWAAVDCFACYLSGQAWRAGQIGDAVIARWARSPDRWWRRAALVSTVPLNNRTQGGHGDAARTLAVCRLLRHDRDDLVVKALSWALRELAKRDPESVRAFLDEHQNDLPSRVLRETRNKLTHGRKILGPAKQLRP